MYDGQKSIYQGTSKPELIRCTRQPGKLRISKGACARQYMLARRMNAKMAKGVFGTSRSWSLEICRTCPKGRLYSETVALSKKTQ